MIDNIAGTSLYRIWFPYQQTAFLAEVSFVGESSENIDTINCIFYNADGSPVKIDVSELYFNGVYQDVEECRPNFGEIESFVSVSGGYEISGDFGCITVYCDSIHPPINVS